MNKRSAAKGQLEAALKLWFDNGDPVSIHALASAANELLHALGKSRGKSSRLQTWIRSQPKQFQSRIFAAQNFFKHGFRDVKGKFAYYPTHGDIVLWDAVLTYETMFKLTPLMQLYFLRFIIEYHDSFFTAYRPAMLRGINLDLLAQSSRRQFREQLLGFLSKHPLRK